MPWLFQHVAFGKIGKGKNPIAITIKNTCKILLLTWRLKLSLGKDTNASKSSFKISKKF
jgi:hypothetical protein